MSTHKTGITTNHALLSLTWLSGGGIIALGFGTGQLPPLEVTVCLLGVLTVTAILSLKITELSLMTRVFVFLFSLPFSATIGYLFDSEFVWWQTPTNILLCQNHPLVNEMLTIVVVGLCGLMSGIEFAAVYLVKPRSVGKGPSQPGSQAANPRQRRTLTMPAVWLLLTVSFACSWLHAPESNIYQAAYASTEAGAGKAEEAGLNSSYLISYLILVLVVLDAELEPRGSRRQVIKLTAAGLVMGYIIVVLQLLRGDRECAGLVAAMVMIFITSPYTATSRGQIKQAVIQMSRLLKMFLPLAFCIVAFLTLGSLRHSASDVTAKGTSLWESITDGASQNTWTAVALNNLGLAADYNFGTIEYLYGRTYLDYFLSLPPGAITKALGYERPMETDANPGKWYVGLIAAGGMHPVVVPFKNFGILGSLFSLFLCGNFICYIETRNERGTLASRLLYGCVATSTMLWFWYGDMNIIRTVMAWGLLYFLHQLASASPPKVYLRPASLHQKQQQQHQQKNRKTLAALS